MAFPEDVVYAHLGHGFLDQLDAEAEKKAAEAPDAAPSGAEAPAVAAGAPDAEGQGAEALSAKTREEIRRLCSETSGTYSLVAMGLSPALQVLPDDQLPNARQIAANLDELRKLLSPPPQQQQQQQQMMDMLYRMDLLLAVIYQEPLLKNVSPFLKMF